MNDRSTRGLMLTSLGLVGLHFLTVVVHSAAHEVLSVKATPAQLAFIIPVIIVGPAAAGLLLPKFERAGAWVLLGSMVGSFAFGLYYHFVADTIDHVSHVAALQPAFWAWTFGVTAGLLLVAEAAGAGVAWLQLAGRPRPLKRYAARTGF